MLDLKELISKPEYAWLDLYKDRICFLTVAGSYGYGLNTETSDIDLRGVILPTKDELIGLKSFKQRDDRDTDTCLYELNRFIHLAKDGNPNVVELLGMREYLVFNDIGEKLIDNAKLFLSKKCYKTFKGYSASQLRKIENSLSETDYTQEQKNKQIFETINVAIDKLFETNNLFKEGSIKVNLEDNDITIDCNIKSAPINLVRASLNDLLSIEKTYNKLGQRNTKKDERHLNKHISHLFRLILTCKDILDKHEMHTYRTEDIGYLMDIKNGKYIKDGKLTEDFSKDLNRLNKLLEESYTESTLQDNCDFNKLNEFVTELNQEIIQDKVVTYKEPHDIVLIY